MGIFKSFFSNSWECPVCGKETSKENAGNVAFNNCSLCDDCSPKVEKVYKGKYVDRAYLEEMKAIVTGVYENTEDNYRTYRNILADLHDEYSGLQDKHLNLLNKLEEQYSVAIHQDKLNNEVIKCILLGLKDIELAGELYTYYSQMNEILKGEALIPSYPAFSKVARLYEVFYHDYLSAIFFCYVGINYGYHDGSKNGFKGKISKYLKKYNKEQGKNYQFDYDNAILFDDDTGEVIDIEKEVVNKK